MIFRMKVYIPVEDEEGELHATKEEAGKEVESLSLMQPENLYEVEAVEENGPTEQEAPVLPGRS